MCFVKSSKNAFFINKLINLEKALHFFQLQIVFIHLFIHLL